MTTVDSTQLPSISTIVLMRLTSMVSRKANARTRTKSYTWMHTGIRVLLTIAGFTCLTLAGFSVSFTLGLVSAALSCFTMAWLAAPSTTETSATPTQRAWER